MNCGGECKSAEGGDLGKDRIRVERMAAHLGPFFRVQLACLVENTVGDAELADVVQQAGKTELVPSFRRHAELLRDGDGNVGDVHRVTEGERRLGVDDLGECLRHPLHAQRVETRRDPRRLQPEHRLDRPMRAQCLPPIPVAFPAAHQIDEPGIEPTAAPLPGHANRAVRALARVKKLDRLRKIRYAREKRDCLALQSARMAKAAPMLVERPDRLACRGRESQPSGDLGAALASNLDDLPRYVPRLRNRGEVAQLFAERGSARHGECGPSGEPRTSMPVRELHPILGILIGGAE